MTDAGSPSPVSSAPNSATNTAPTDATAQADAAAARRSPIVPLVDLHGRSPWSILPPLILGFFMIMLDTTIVNIAVPTLVQDLDASLVAVGWVTSAYLLSYATLLLLAGRLGDRFGSRRVFIGGLVVFTVASAACGFAGHIALLIAARAVQGIGAALMTPQTMAMITRVFPPERRGAAMGLWGATAGVATIAGPLLGGVFVEYMSWEWIFFINVPVGVVALWFALRNLPKLERHRTSFDVVGVVLSVLGLGAFVFGIQEGSTYDWGTIAGPISVWSVIGLGVLILVVFLWWQARLGEAALLPLRLFRNRTFTLANVSGMTISFAMIGIFFPLTIFLQSILGLSPIETALLNLPSSLISGVVAPLAGRLSDRVPGKWVVSAGFAMIAISVGVIAWLIQPDLVAWHLIFPMLLFGAGTGSVFSPLANLATSGLDGRTAGAGAGAFNTTRQVGGVLGSAVIVSALTSRLASRLPEAAEAASGQLPADYRQSFVDGITQAASAGSFSGESGGAASFPLPDGVPDAVKQQIDAVVTSVIHQGFASAVTDTMIVVTAVLVIGFFTALLIPATRPGHLSPRQ
ncbi:multidrug efflux MFS transporter [Miniimonas arenae]|uniref:Multidrug efflux MFS transporter n=1 Tax=Miniimonas arenae TaxID=676201 RepID=A0A5C5BBG3_9MICO|nr:MDR family MFS transporter [Miniimonas arenae]TNU74865.1 multidrug efflux MFS transporter [Miniimonas arenae]